MSDVFRKTCFKCKISKTSLDFNYSKDSPDKRQHYCKPCQKVTKDNWHLRNARKLRAANKARWLGMPKEERLALSKGRANYLRGYSLSKKRRWKTMLHSCKRLGIPSDIELSDYEEIFKTADDKCYYCAKVIEHTSGASLDRLNSDRGYTKDNVVPCCYSCNMAKNKFSVEIFLEHVKTIYQNCVKKGLIK